MKGFNINPLLELLNAVDIPVIYSGGVTSLSDIEKLSANKCLWGCNWFSTLQRLK